MIRVLARANSAVELSRLEALVRSIPSLALAGSCLGRASLSEQLAETRPDVLLECFDPDDFEESRLPAFEWTGVARVLLTVEAEFVEAVASIREPDSAVRGVLPAWASAREIQTAIEAAAGGMVVLHPDVAAVEASSSRSRESTGQELSPRESEILNLLAGGLGNKEIAWQLKISEHTVKFHVTSIFNKLNVSTRAEAVVAGIRRGLIIL